MKMNVRLSGFVVAIFVGLVLPRAIQAEARVETNVIYGMYSGLALLMDIHYPEQPNGYGIVFIPGSGWTAPLSPDAAPLKQGVERPHLGGSALLDAGYTLFSINHRAVPRFHYPAPVEDAQRAVRYVRHNAADFGIDPDRIGASGGSSGGHLASMVGVLDGDGSPGASSPVDRESSKVQTVAVLYPPTDFIEIVRGGGQGAPLLAPSLNRRQLQNEPNSDEARIFREASPTTYVSPDDPPFLLIHGDQDPVVPYAQSEVLEAALKANGIPVELIRMPGGGHGASVSAGPDAPDYLAPMVEWFDTYLKDDQ
ncbi:MAG: prolyl oligopeptidase family serine peptidase [Gammaproteobacteria bacterium]